MKIAEVKNSILNENCLENSFGFLINDKSFKVVYDLLAQDKIAYVIRELSTNAYDSHVAAGKPEVPFVVHMPSSDNLFYYVEDSGIGLSKEKLVSTFTTFFASDKSESNDFVGCLGLGSKSPFGYGTRSFIVDSWHEGKHYAISLYLGEDGCPKYSIMIEEETDHPNGVRVTVPVLESDIANFENKAKSIYYYFKTRPTILNSNLTINEKAIILQGDDYYITKDNTAKAVMGNVGYPLSFTDSRLTETHKKLLASGLVIHFNIGELEIGSGREALSYTDKTILKIISKLDNVILNINENINNKIKSSPNLFSARMSVLSMKKDNNIISSFCDTSKLFFNNKKLFDNKHEVSCDIKGVSIIKFFRKKNYGYYYTAKVYKANSNKIDFDSDFIIYYDNLKGNHGRAEHVVKTMSTIVYLASFDDDDAKKLFLETIGKDELVDINSTILPKANLKVKNISQPKFNWLLKDNITESISNYWGDSCKDIESGGIYISKVNCQCLIDKKTYHPRHVLKFIKFINLHSGKRFSVYGINEKNVKKLNNKWVSFDDWFKKELLAIHAQNNIFNLRKTYNSISELNKELIKNIGRLKQYLPTNHPLVGYYNHYEFCSEKVSKYSFDVLSRLAHVLYLYGINESGKTDFKHIDVYKKYPLLEVLEVRASESIIKELSIYVEKKDEI